VLQLYSSNCDDNSFQTSEATWQDLRIGARIVWTPDGMPICDLAPRARTPVGKYNSRKAGRFLAHRSRGHGFVGGEKLALMRHEINPLVYDLRTYHIRFDLVVGGAARSYIPPILLAQLDGRLTVQHITTRTLRAGELRLLSAVNEVCMEVGWGFEVVTDQQIAATACVRDNIIAIQAERYASFSATDLLTVTGYLRSKGGTAPLVGVADQLGHTRPTYPIVKALMCHGHVSLPLEQRIDGQTPVSLAPVRPARASEFLP
jgi:hypothetical protein